MASVYHINKGINRPIVFNGIKGQYIAWLAMSMVLLFLGFATLYLIGVPIYITLPLILGLAILIIFMVMHLSNRFGVHGLAKFLAKRRLPAVLKFRSRRLFITLKYPHQSFETRQ